MLNRSAVVIGHEAAFYGWLKTSGIKPEAIGDRKDGRIEIRAGEAGHGMVEIGFTDNGGGVPRDKFASLFEPFYTTKRDGLGMGLPLVRSIAEEHGGRVRLDNQPGRGLAVYLRLPARRP